MGIQEDAHPVTTSLRAAISFLHERSSTHASDTIISSSLEHAPDLARLQAQLSIMLAWTLCKKVGPFVE